MGNLPNLWRCVVGPERAYTPARSHASPLPQTAEPLILPLLVARALIPAGFMMSVDAGQLQLMFCPSGVVQPLPSPKATAASACRASASPGMRMHHGGGADQSSSLRMMTTTHPVRSRWSRIGDPL